MKTTKLTRILLTMVMAVVLVGFTAFAQDAQVKKEEPAKTEMKAPAKEKKMHSHKATKKAAKAGKKEAKKAEEPKK